MRCCHIRIVWRQAQRKARPHVIHVTKQVCNTVYRVSGFRGVSGFGGFGVFEGDTQGSPTL